MNTQQNYRGVTQNNGNAGLAAGTTSTYTTTATTIACIRGPYYTQLTAQTNTASPTLDANTGVAFLPLVPNRATVLVWGVNAAGAIQLVQGTIEPTVAGVTTTPGAFINYPAFPVIPDDFCPLAYSIHRTAPSAASWVPGVGAWAASGVVSTFRNIGTLPDRPQPN